VYSEFYTFLYGTKKYVSPVTTHYAAVRPSRTEKLSTTKQLTDQTTVWCMDDRRSTEWVKLVINLVECKLLLQSIVLLACLRHLGCLLA